MGMTYRMRCNGVPVSLFGYGAMRLPTVDGGFANEWDPNASKAGIDQRALNAQIKRMLDGGVTYFDTSPCYSRGESERRLGEALAASGYARKDYVLTTKLSNFAKSQWSLAECKKLLEGSLKALRTDYVDNYLLHSIGNGGMNDFLRRFVTNGALDWLVEERKAGRIRNLGFSFHGDAKTFEWCMANHGKYHWDLALIQMNYVDWRHAQRLSKRNLNAEYLYDELWKRRIPVTVMEPLLGGALARYNRAVARELVPLAPEDSLARWAFRFCGTFPGVMTVLSGVSRMEHIDENIRTFSPLRPCDERELAALESAAKAYLAGDPLPCTACNYCMPCPYGLDIPALLRFRNDYLAGKPSRSAREVLAAYGKAVPDPFRRAEHCTGCGRCNSHCPQSIDIPAELESLDRAIEHLHDQELVSK